MCLKKKFATKRDAAKELKRSLLRQARGNRSRRERDLYHCQCGAYHLTSQEATIPADDEFYGMGRTTKEQKDDVSSHTRGNDELPVSLACRN